MKFKSNLICKFQMSFEYSLPLVVEENHGLLEHTALKFELSPIHISFLVI